jgi:hypothetical protein
LLTPLFVMACAYAGLFITLWLLAMKAEILAQRVHQMQVAQAGEA